MERYVEKFGPFRFMIIYSSLYVLAMLSVSYVAYKLLLDGPFSLKLGVGLGIFYLGIGIWISRKHVLQTEE